MTAVRVLIVDDEPSIVSLLARSLQARGYQVRSAAGGQEAIALLESESFDLLIVDLKMPDVDGLTVIRRGKELDPYLAVLVITGFVTLDSVLQALYAGAQAFVLKPFGPQELLDAVDRTLTRRQQEQEWLWRRVQRPILEIARVLSGPGAGPDMAQRLLETILPLLSCDRGALFLLDDESGELYVAAVAGMDVAPAAVPRVPTEAPGIAQVLAADRPLVLGTGGETAIPLLPEHRDRHTAVLAPLRTAQRAFGLLYLSQPPDNPPFSPTELNLLLIISAMVAVVLENARLQARIARAKREWEAIFDTIAEAVSIHDDRHRIIRANRSLAERLHTTPQALIGRHCHEVIHHTDSPPVWCPCNGVLQTGQSRKLEIEEPNLGGMFLLSVYLLPLENGRYGYIHVWQDITDRKRMEADRVRSERLAAVGQVAATIVHEVRNTLSGISSGLQYLEGTFAPDDFRREACAMLEGELEQAFRIIEDIRLVIRPLVLERRLCSLEMLVEKVLRQMMPLLSEAGLTVRRAYDQVPQLHLDVLRIEQALTNLLRNAIEAAPRGSEIEIALRRGSAEDRPGAVLLSIADRGFGMSPEVLARATEPFFTTKPTGLGLGLAVARRLVEAHGGALELSSGRGTGTVATVILPLDFVEEGPTAPGGNLD